MGTDATRRAVYACPHCREELEASPSPWHGWQLCPRCGQAGPPPERSPASAANRSRNRSVEGGRGERPHSTLAHGDFDTGGVAKRPPDSRLSLLALVPVLAIAAISLIVYLDQLNMVTAELGLVALALFGLLASVGNRSFEGGRGERPPSTLAHGVFVTSGVAKLPPGPGISPLALVPVLVVAASMSLIVYLGQLDIGTAGLGLVALALFGLLSSVGKRK